MHGVRVVLPTLLLLLAGAGGCGDDDYRPPPDNSARAAKIRAWPRLWCDVKPKMTRGEVYRIMGAPSNAEKVTDLPSSYGIGSRAEWSRGGGPDDSYTLTAFFYEDDTVAQLQAGRAPVRCARVRRG